MIKNQMATVKAIQQELKGLPGLIKATFGENQVQVV